jgi:hypothetical protein
MCFARATNVPTAVSGGATVNLPPGVKVVVFVVATSERQ